MLDALDEAGLADDPIAIFTSDNGPVDNGSTVSFRRRGPCSSSRRPTYADPLPPHAIHPFGGEQGTGLTVSSEVSSLCDDGSSKVFLEPAERFPTVDEDADPTHYLCHEYPRA